MLGTYLEIGIPGLYCIRPIAKAFLYHNLHLRGSGSRLSAMQAAGTSEFVKGKNAISPSVPYTTALSLLSGTMFTLNVA